MQYFVPSLTAFPSLPLYAKGTGYCPQGFTGATIEPDGRQELSLSLFAVSLSLPLPPNNQLKAHYTRHHMNNVHRCRKFANAKWYNLEMYFRSVVILRNELSDVEFVTAVRETGLLGLATGSSDGLS
jgi:hypothetical protein